MRSLSADQMVAGNNQTGRITRPRLVVVMGRLLDQEDGLGVYGINLLKELMTLDGTTQYLILLNSSKHRQSFADFPNAETRVVKARTKTWWDQVVVPLVAKEVRADIIFNPKFSIPLFTRRATVMVLQSADWYVNPQNYKWWDNLYIRLIMPLYCRKATHLLSISKCIRDDLERFIGVDKTKVTVTYAAPSPHFSNVASDEEVSSFRDHFRLPPRFILAVARTYHTGFPSMPAYPGGNVEGLIRGYLQYRSSGGELPLVVAGKDIDQYLIARRFDLAKFPEVHFTGFIPHQLIALAYKLADFMVLTTLYESFGLPLIEAMASGCPVIAPSTGACPEIAGGAARLVDPRDSYGIASAMMELTGSRETRQRLRLAGLERARAFSWKRTAELTLGALDSIHPLETASPRSGLMVDASQGM